MFHRKKVVVAALVAVVAAVAAVGASASKGATASSSSAPLIGVVSISTADYGNHETIAGIKAAAKTLGWKVDVIDANGSADAANAAIQNLVARHAKAIFDLVFPTSSLSAGLGAAAAAHIPVGTWGGGLGKGVVVTDGGGGAFAKPVVQYMAKRLGAKGAILALTYHVGLVCRQREQVFDQVLASHKGIKVTKNEIQIPGYQSQAPQTATGWLAAHRKGSQPLAIWGCWEDPAIAALSALRQQGRTDVMSFGENGGPTAMSDIVNGTLTATEWENSFLEGQKLVQNMNAAIKAGASWKPKVVNVPGILVTKDNVHAFLKAHKSLFPGLK
jgi:ribose transport system substrate-binding protein